MSRTYSLRLCYTCRRHVSTAGAAYVAHMRKHVREGLLTEHLYYMSDGTERREFDRVIPYVPTAQQMRRTA